MNFMNRQRLYLIAGLVLLAGFFPVHLLCAPGTQASRRIAIQGNHSVLLNFKVPITRASVANEKIADVRVLTPTQILVVATTKGGAAGSTTLIVWQENGAVQVVDVAVYTAIPQWVIASLQQRIAQLTPGVEVKVSPASATPGEQRIILSGTVPSIAVLNEVVTIAESYQIGYYNLMRVGGPQQVQLKVVVAEVSKSGLKQMGLSFIRLSERFSMLMAKGGDFSFEGDTDSGITLMEDLSSPFSSAFNLALLSSKNNIGGVLALLKNQGLARTLATPTLVTMNGQQAEFLVGGTLMIPKQGDNGATNIEEKDYGIMLKFTPYILGENAITLEVAPEVSAPDYSLGTSSGGTSVPGLTQRKASTTLQLRPGQTFAMAGLIKEEFHETLNKVPFLGDIPYIGTAFTSKETQHSESELVIMVTPTIVRPMAADQVPELPGSRFPSKLSDADFFIKNRFRRQAPTEKGRTAAQGYKGMTGFVK